MPLIESKMMKSGSAFVCQRDLEVATTLDHSNWPSWSAIEATGLISRLDTGSSSGYIVTEAGERVAEAGEFVLHLDAQESEITHTAHSPTELSSTYVGVVGVVGVVDCVGDSGLGTSENLSHYELAELLKPTDDVWAEFGQRRHLWRRFVAINGANDVPVSAKILMQTVGITRSRAFDAMKAVREMKYSPVRKSMFYGSALGDGKGQGAANVKRKRAASARKAHREILMGAEAVFVGEPGVFRRFTDVYPQAEQTVAEPVLTVMEGW
ncbi:MAG: hypothetical protein HHJ10_01235 [Cellulomonas sp.]|nr:hypothetical protein [Cellulomonas sp.]